jgi:hypothetical protein
MYARTFPEQLAIVLGRANRSYNRNTGYVYTKTMVLWGLLIMFGVRRFLCAAPCVFACPLTPSLLPPGHLLQGPERG